MSNLLPRRRSNTQKIGRGLIGAIQEGDYDKMSIFLKKSSGSEKKLRKILSVSDESGQQPIHIAASGGDIEAIKILVEEDVQCINSLDGSQWTPLLCAAANSHFEACSYIIKIPGCNIMAQNKSGTSALHQLVRKIPSEDKKDIYAELLEAYFSSPNVVVDVQNKLLETPLHQASMRGNIIAVKALLGNGADISIRSSNEETALHFAVRGGSEAVVDLLLEHGADPKEMGNFGSSIDVAISTNQQNMINKLSEIADENLFTKSSRTPNLLKVLNHPELCIIFFYYLSKQYCAENLSFYMDVKKLQRIDDTEVESFVKDILAKYVKEGSFFEINIDSGTRKALLKRPRKGKGYKRNMFEQAMKEVMVLLENDSYPKFIVSPFYKNFLEGKTFKEDALDKKATALRDHFVAMVEESRNSNTLANSQGPSQ